MSAVPADTYRAAVRCLVGFDERANLPKIGVPVLCLAGEKDPNAPAAVVERMAGKIPGARYVCLPGVGHLPNLEAPAAFDAAILIFCARCWHSDLLLPTWLSWSGLSRPSIHPRAPERAVAGSRQPEDDSGTVCHELTRSRPARHRRADLRSRRVPSRAARSRADRQGARASAPACLRPAPPSTIATPRFRSRTSATCTAKACSPSACPRAKAAPARASAPTAWPRPSSAAIAAPRRCRGTCTCARRCGPARWPTTSR